MSIQTEITRLQSDRNTIRDKLVNFGLAKSTDNLDALATAIDGIVNQGDVSAEVQEGATYTIPKGYHTGSGTVSGVKGGGNYTLQSKIVTPTKSSQQITPDAGKYGLSDVTVNPIPDAYQNTSVVNATAPDVLAGKIIVDSEGTTITGTMANNGAVSKTLDTGTTSYTVPKGYHSGSGTVKIVVEDKTVTPTEVSQTISASNGNVIRKVTVNSIPNAYKNAYSRENILGFGQTDLDASGSTTRITDTDDSILPGKAAIVIGEDEDGNKIAKNVVGSMKNNGAVSKTLDTTTISYTIPQGYHSGSGIVQVVTETKSATPTTKSQTISASSGKVLKSVTVNPIPQSYLDAGGKDAALLLAQSELRDNGSTTLTTVEDNRILSGVAAVVCKRDSSGKYDGTTQVVKGSMVNQGAVSKTLDTSVTSYTVPVGYHNGSGTVKVVTETRTVSPTEKAQTITATSGKVIKSVTVNAIDSVYVESKTMIDDLEKIINTTGNGIVATSAQILDGYSAIGNDGNSNATETVGTMPNRGAINGTINGLTTMSYTIPAGYHNGSGKVSLTSDIENTLKAI